MASGHHPDGGDRFELLLERAPFGVYVVGADFRIVFANGVARAGFDDAGGAVVGRHYGELVHQLRQPHQANDLERIFRHTLETGEPFVSTHWMRETPGGPAASFEWRTERLTLEDGAAAVACYYVDVSDRIRTEQALLESERTARQQLADLDATYSAAPVGLCLFDREFRFRRINPTLAAMNGLPPEAHLGRTPHEVVPAIASQAEALFRQVMETGRPVLLELRGTTPADPQREHIWEEHWFPIGGNGHITGVGAVVQDVTDQRAAQEALREAGRRKDEFVAILAHELRNPLAPVRNAAHMLRNRDFSDPELSRTVHMIDRQVAHMARLVDDLLDVSRVTRGTLALRLERLDFREIVHAAVTACRADVDARGHELRVALPDHAVTLHADRDRLMQVFCNLLNNAARYTPPGGHLAFVTRAEGDWLEVAMRDDGIGIARDQLGRVFELFAQVDGSLDRQSGLGIGLTLARQLVELHRGTIEAHSDGPGRGSTFVVRLPLAPPAAAATGARTPERACEPRRVLVTDDNADAAESLAGLLKLDGHDVHIAFDGGDALARAAECQPEVAFIDIGMPRMNGYELARRLRETPWGRRMFLIALTGWGQETDRERSHAAGFDAHLVKPASPEAMRRLLAGPVSRPG